MKLLKKSSLFLLFVYILTFNIIKINALDTKKNSPSASPITNIQINSDVPRGTLTTQHNLSVSTTCDSSFLYNIDTGIVYSNKNDNAILPVASISKTFTLYLIFDKLSKNELKLDEKIGLSSKAAYIEKMLGNTSTNLDPNKKYTVDELLKLSIVPSSNGAIIALNEYLFGSEEKALEKVKQLFDKMSIKRYSLVNVSGLTNKDYMNFKNKSFPDQSGNSISSRDYAKFLHNFIERFPKYFDYSKIVSFEYDSIEGKKKAVTTNYLLPGQSQHFKGTIGFKTGHTPFAKYNNAVVIDREKGGRIGAFAFGCNTLGERYSEVKKLAKAYYENPNLRLLLAKNFKVSSNIEIYGSLVRSTNTYIKNDFWIDMSKEEVKDLKYSYQYKTGGMYLRAPIKSDEIVGNYIAQLGNNTYDFLYNDNKIMLPMVTNSNIDKSNPFVAFFISIGNYFERLVSELSSIIQR